MEPCSRPERELQLLPRRLRRQWENARLSALVPYATRGRRPVVVTTAAALVQR